ncbi:ATP-binding protein [Actinoallomurus purpureus]|uniref:ATP-binding protein n=1 Tax=Actinoallomurus purpureus TaxID=478114 RepID=UPI0020920D79|nr:ATP-binding protein [Actinoallomurus purpureus]MCO6003638.1 ATP-binding protein [Actinoallomurus purpureus]
MSASNDHPSPWAQRNPFPSSAVASIRDPDSALVTVETPAIREADRRLDDYLAHRTTSNGNVLAVVGEFGTGKTHLLHHLLRRADLSGLRDINWRYVDSPADTFLALYLERFIGRMKSEDVSARVRDYYAEIVARSLDGLDLRVDVQEGFRDGSLDPQTIAARLGLSSDLLLRNLQARLRAVTKNDAYGTALSLLLRPGFESAAWEWLGGSPPHQLLVERGVTTAIATDAAALESIGVFALLYGGQDHRFILMFDELEKILSADSRPETSTAQAFKKLLEVSRDAGAFLVLSGVRDFLKPLGGDTLDRIGPPVRMSALSSTDVRRFIEESLREVLGERTIAPFTPETISYLTHLTGGNPRQVVQLCGTLYERAAGVSAVTEPMVREAVRENFESLTVDDMRAEVRRLLNTRGWPFMRDHVYGDPSMPRVDYWVPVGGDDTGIALLLTDSVLEPAGRDRLEHRLRAVQEACPGSRILLIVNGLAPDLAVPMEEEPLVYQPNRFAEDFDAALIGAVGRLESRLGGDAFALVRERMDRMYQMQSHTQDHLEQFADSLDAMRSSYEQQLRVLRQEIEGIAQTVPVAGLEMPPQVRRLFDEAQAGLEEFDDIEGLIARAFTADRDDGRVARRVLLQRLRRGYQPIGVATLMRHLVTVFQGQVAGWYQALRSVHPDRAELNRLAALCDTYDALYEQVPTFQLDDTARPAAPAPGLGPGRSGNREVRKAFERLGIRVKKAMLESFETA